MTNKLKYKASHILLRMYQEMSTGVKATLKSVEREYVSEFFLLFKAISKIVICIFTYTNMSSKIGVKFSGM